MANKVKKPKKLVSQLILEMKNNRGITFNYIDESVAANYLSNINNYLRTASYRKNYQKYQKGAKQGKYIQLDFSYLVEMSILDMHYRFLVQKMCSDIEHSMCVNLIHDVEKDVTPHTGDLLKKYFTIKQTTKNRSVCYEITNYEDCPVWVLMELLSFGSIINFYLDYYTRKNSPHIQSQILNLVRSLRNAAAHNNCILYDLNPGTTVPPQAIIKFVKGIPGITTSSRRKRLSSRAILEFVALIYVYDQIVTGKVKKHRFKELDDLFNKRMKEKAGFFKNNQLINSTYTFLQKIVNDTIK